MSAENWLHAVLAVLIVAVGVAVALLTRRGDRHHARLHARLEAIESEIAEHRASVEREP